MGLGSLVKKAWNSTGGKVLDAATGEGGVTDTVFGLQITGEGGLLDTALGGSQITPEELKETGKAFQDMQYDPNVANFGINDINAQQANNTAAANAAANRDAPQATAASMQAASGTNATIDTGAQNQMRANQLALINRLINPNGPSAAQMQLQRGTDAAIAAQRAMAASSRGVPAGLANKIAATNAADITAKGAADAAILRAQEDQARQGLLAQTLQGARSQDIGIASEQAGLQQQTLMQNAGFSQEAAQQNAAMAQQTALANLQAGMTQQQQNDAMVQFYLGLNLSLDQAQLAAGMALEQLMADQAMAAMNATAGIVSQNAASQQQATGALLGAGGTILGGAMMASDVKLKTKVKKADINKFLDKVSESIPSGPLPPGSVDIAKPTMPSAAVQSGAAGRNAAPAGANPAAAAGLAAPALGAPQIGPGVSVPVPSPAGASNPWAWGMMQAGMNYSKMMSDKDQKEKISDADVEEFMDSAEGKEYEYKDKEQFGSAPRLGVMAQDLQRSALGKEMVTETKDGDLVVATGDLGMGAVFASLGNLHKRIDQLEREKQALLKKGKK